MSVVCHQCGKTATEEQGQYGTRHSCHTCDLHSWNGKPLTTQATLDARRDAHLAFDLVWISCLVPRTYAYRALRNEMNIEKHECHISLFDLEQALSVPKHTLSILTRLEHRSQEQAIQQRKLAFESALRRGSTGRFVEGRQKERLKAHGILIPPDQGWDNTTLRDGACNLTDGRVIDRLRMIIGEMYIKAFRKEKRLLGKSVQPLPIEEA